MRIHALVLAGALMVSGAVPLWAQISGSPPPPAIGAKQDPARGVDGLLSMMEGQVVGAAKAMPADKYKFRPGAKHFCPGPDDEVRYCAHLCGTGDAPGAGELLLFRLERHQA